MQSCGRSQAYAITLVRKEQNPQLPPPPFHPPRLGQVSTCRACLSIEAQFQRHSMPYSIFYFEKDPATPWSLRKSITRTLRRQAKRHYPHSSGQSSTITLTGPSDESSMRCRSSAP
ncbi:hypothetical protein J4E82_005966 [Alternaria postmessia]|uniref:uncharacterized protein n=1 Tax=Alternaria postmessia TaxID=1187938 RepID=UPI002224F58B|nr:uncharacterized protein J4E82_005966 [Alternaria postmessia]KAI5375314.1 hypothetical protein J4E82_005966 [Alternaria postmessia]